MSDNTESSGQVHIEPNDVEFPDAPAGDNLKSFDLDMPGQGTFLNKSIKIQLIVVALLTIAGALLLIV